MYIRSECGEYHLLCHLGASHNTGQVTSLVRRERTSRFFQLSPFNRRFSVIWMTRMGDGWLVTNRRGFEFWMCEWMGRLISVWMDGWMDGWLHGWVDE